MTFKPKTLLLLALGLSFVFPFLFLFLMSLTTQWRYPALFPSQLIWINWTGLFATQSGLLNSLFLSLAISTAVATTVTSLGFLTSRSITSYGRDTRLLLIAYLPYILSPVVVAACLNFFFVKFGLAGNISGVILAQLIIAYPFSVIFFSNHWTGLMKSMEDLVATLGGTSVQTFFKVILPVSKGMLLVCFFQTFLISWFEYGLTTIIGVGKIQTLTIRVYQYVIEANIYYAALSSCLLMIPPILMLWLNKRTIFRKLI